ncbi:MAG TPA: manganese efflux pump MntP family protein [Candidatus Sulfomarinibacteraceae bacterium]|nr:manganese efflux pump MntP family protein [Candidatus Sulfomarinibacteraceae bacterium]
MTLVEMLAVAVGMAMDAFAVSLAGGAGGRLRRPRPAIRLAFHLGLFQFMMPVIGWYGGSRAAHLVGSFDHWVAFALLAFVGGRMIRSGLRPQTEESLPSDPSRGWTLVAVSVATSIDALAVGVSLAMVGIDIWQPSVVIGVVTATLSLVGIAIGGRVGTALGPKVEIAGGLLLLVIGLRIVADHL